MNISVVTISFNQAEFLEDSLLSVLEQRYPGLEYVVVDGGSTDGSKEVLEKYRERLGCLVIERDKGPADALDKGFANTTGDILGFLNSDDLLLPDALHKVAEFFRTRPAVDVVSGHSLVIDAEGNCLRKSYSDHFSLRRYAYGGVVLMQPSTFFRANAYRRTNGFNVNNKSNWDGELFVDMALCGAKFAIMNHFLSAYRLHPASITQSRKLHDAIKEHGRRMFKKIIGREENGWDRLLRYYFLGLKYLREPRSLFQRATRGPVYGRRSKTA